MNRHIVATLLLYNLLLRYKDSWTEEDRMVVEEALRNQEAEQSRVCIPTFIVDSLSKASICVHLLKLQASDDSRLHISSSY